MNTQTQVRATSPRRPRAPRKPAARLVPCTVCEMPVLTCEPAPLCYVCRFAATKALLGMGEVQAADEPGDDALDEAWGVYADHMGV